MYDVKGIDMGNGLVRYKAEIDFDGRELARSYLERYLLRNYVWQMIVFLMSQAKHESDSQREPVCRK